MTENPMDMIRRQDRRRITYGLAGFFAAAAILNVAMMILDFLTGQPIVWFNGAAPLVMAVFIWACFREARKMRDR